MAPRRKGRLAVLAAAALIVAGATALPAAFAAGDAGLNGSDFEIETDANLKLDGSAPNLDWATVNEVRQADLPTGTGDNSFGQGTKEDTAVPTVVSGSIPPNKSDLKFFGGYQEGSSSSGFLHLFWSRVQEPSGTTNMDFEFNKNKCVVVAGTPTADSVCSSNGVTPVRSIGDLLITYDLAQGGTNAVLGKRTWQGTEWGPYTEFEDSVATGTINTSPIPAADADGLGAHSARTFGEASIRLSGVLDTGTAACTGFGSAYLKSRSSDSFTAALKDFIAPIPINLTNCGTINITKTDDANPANALNGATFTLYTDVNDAPGVVFDSDTDTAGTQALTCTTSGTGADAGKCSIGNVPFGTYWVVETTTPAGYDTAPPQEVTVSSQNGTVSVSFIDPRQRGAIKVTKTFKDASSSANPKVSPHAGVTFTLKQGSTTVASGSTNANGVVCFDNLLFGSYSVVETVPANFSAETGAGTTGKSVSVDNKATCGGDPYAGESVSFVNTPLSSITVSFTSTVQGVAGDATASQISCTGLTADTPDATPGAFDDLSESFGGLAPGTYTCTVVVDP